MQEIYLATLLHVNPERNNKPNLSFFLFVRLAHFFQKSCCVRNGRHDGAIIALQPFLMVFCIGVLPYLVLCRIQTLGTLAVRVTIFLL